MDLGAPTTATSSTEENLSMEDVKIANPGQALDELGVSCELLYTRFRKTGNHSGVDGMWNALQEFSTLLDRVEQPDEFGTEM